MLVSIPESTSALDFRGVCWSEVVKDTLLPFIEMMAPIPIKTTPPTNHTTFVTKSLSINLLIPLVRTTTTTISGIICPRTRMGPAQNPLFAASLMVTTSSGPGDRAPERLTTKDVVKMRGRLMIST